MASVTDPSETTFQHAAFPPMPVCRLGVDQYEEMIRAGIVTKDSRIELLDGWLVPKMTKNPPRVVASALMRNALSRAVPEGWCVCSEAPVQLPASMPEPDAMVVRGELRQYCRQRMRAEHIGLVVEVADASLQRDQVFKKSIYAQAGIPVYWLVNLSDGRIEVYTDPAGSQENADYRQRHDYSATDTIPLLLDGRRVAEIAVRELLP